MTQLIEDVLPPIQSAGLNTAKAISTTSTITTTSTISASGSVTSLSGTATTAGGATTAGLAMGTAAVGIYFGSGVPTISAAQGSLYLRTDGSSTSTRAYVNTNGTTGWTAITTAT